MEPNKSVNDETKAKNAPLVFDAHNGFVTALVFLQNGDLASGGDEIGGGMITIWDVNTGRQPCFSLVAATDHLCCNSLLGSAKQKFLAHFGHVLQLAVLTNGSLVSTSTDSDIRVWQFDARKQEFLSKCLINTAHKHIVHSLSVFASNMVLTASHDATIAISSPETGRQAFTATYSCNIGALAAVSDARFVSGHYSRIDVWSTTEQKIVDSVEADSYLLSIQALPSHGQVVVNTWDKKISVWNVGSLNLVKTWVSHTAGGVGIGPMAVIRCQDLVVCCAGNRMKIRNLKTGATEQTSCAKHVDAIRCVAVSKAGHLIASASNNQISLLAR